jgi:predicted amidohydrolase YtcJ
MPAKIDDLLPTAKAIQRQAALEKAGKADEQARNQAAAQTEKQKLIEKLTKPSGLSEDEKVKLASRVIQRAVRNGLTEVQVYRFPNSLCTDKGRAINQMEAGWEKTLTGMAKEIYQLWADHLQPRGYRIRYQVIDYSGGIPGDIGITVSWGD